MGLVGSKPTGLQRRLINDCSSEAVSAGLSGKGETAPSVSPDCFDNASKTLGAISQINSPHSAPPLMTSIRAKPPFFIAISLPVNSFTKQAHVGIVPYEHDLVIGATVSREGLYIFDIKTEVEAIVYR